MTMHKKERTQKLRTAFDTMDRKEALAYAVKELGYTVSGASSWFSWWTTHSKTETAVVVSVTRPAQAEVAVVAPTTSGKPWEQLGISKSSYYRRKKKGSLEFMN